MTIGEINSTFNRTHGQWPIQKFAFLRKICKTYKYRIGIFYDIFLIYNRAKINVRQNFFTLLF
jgi:hypothetical protein